MKNKLVLFSIVIFLFSFLTSSAFAQTRFENRRMPTADKTAVPEGTIKPLRTANGTAKPVRSTDPATTEKRIRACEARENAIKQRSKRLLDLGENMFAKFGAITTRTKEYYAEKGLTLSNYDALVKSIADAKAKTETSLDKATDNLESFNCRGSVSPKEQIMKYNENMKQVNTDLKEYKKSVRNLIVAVHSKAEEK